MAISSQMRTSLVFAWLGMCILAVFDDVKYWGLHNFGVAIMMLGGFAALFYSSPNSPQQAKLFFIIAVFLISTSRMIIKGIAIMIDMNMGKNLFSLSPWFALLTDPGLQQEVLTRSIDVMYRGELACSTLGTAHYTLTLFKVAGVLQWVTFYLLLEGLLA